MKGHVFAVQGDLKKLACDHWLLPCDAGRWVSDAWKGYRDRIKQAAAPEGWGSGGCRSFRLSLEDGSLPQPWLTNTGGWAGKDVGWYLDAVDQFVKGAAGAARNGQRFIEQRAIPLLGLPLIGTGAGGKRSEADAVLQALWPKLVELAAQHEVDLALVLNDAAAYAAAASCRAKMTGTWPAWERELAEAAKTLVDAAVAGELVVFAGAGVSAGANVPTWTQLLEELAREARLLDQHGDDFRRLEPMDRAIAIKVKMPNLGAEVRKIVEKHRHPSLCHLLLAQLPVREMVTTNYDRLWEEACASQGGELVVLPYGAHGATKSPHRWVLKMHGCVTHPDDIVLTRLDFLRYSDTRAALAGIVQAMLMTKHMMFVGFSMSDHNLHRVLDDVRKALCNRQETRRAFATCLSISGNPLMNELWQGEVKWVEIREESLGRGTSADSTGGRRRTEGDVSKDALLSAARQQEIFLDYLAQESSGRTLHLLERKYDGLLDRDEQALAEALEKLREAACGKGKDPTWSRVWRLLEEYGAKA